jgi:hypothetical protein
MIGTLRRHSQSLWWIIIVAIIITFVYWGSQSSRNNGGGGGNGDYGTLLGRPITPLMLENARREVRLYHYFSTGNFPGSGRTIQGFDIEREAYNRLLVIFKAADLGIEVSPETAGKAAADRLRMINRGNPVPVAEFELRVLAPERLNLSDFERYIRNDLAIQQLISTVAMGGQLVPPQEVEALYRRDYQELTVQAAFFHASNNLASITVTPEEVSEFYTNQQARYRLPERAQISLVRFPISNYLAQAEQELAQVTNLNELIEARLEEIGTNYLALGATPEEAKEKMRADAFKQALFKAANDEAKKFDNLLYDYKEPLTPEAFGKLAKDAGLTAEVTAPFTREEPPTGLDVGVNFARLAFSLSAEDPLSEPVAGENHLYVIAFNRHLPSEQPAFEAVKDRVTEDYRYYGAAMKARQQGIEFQASATNAVAAGQSFAEVGAKAGVKPVTLPPLALATRELPEVANMLDLAMLKRAAFATPPGQVGPVLPSADGVAVIFVEAKLPVDENKMRENLPAFTRDVHQVRRGEVFNEWFRREAEQAFRTVPYFAPKQTEMQSAPAQP